MAKKVTKVGVVNIVIHPHSPQMYSEMIKESAQVPAQVYGEKKAILQSITSDKSNIDKGSKASPLLVGDIITFLDVNIDSDWFSVKKADIADDNDKEGMHIPEDLKPHGTRFSFLFDPNTHLFFYEAYFDGNTLGAKNIVRFLKNVFGKEPILRKYGDVQVTHIPDIEKINEALLLKTKKNIKMFIQRPNADDLAETELEVMRRLGQLNADSQEICFKAKDNESLQVDAPLKDMAKIAAKNGYLTVKGKNKNGNPEVISTKEHPMLEQEYYNPNQTTPFNAFRNLVDKTKNKLKAHKDERST